MASKCQPGEQIEGETEGALEIKDHLSENKIAILKCILRLACALRKGIPVKNIKYQLKLKHTLAYTVPLTELGCKFAAKVQFVIFR